jgi:hypothetical protein
MMQTNLTSEKLRQHLKENIERMNAEQLMRMYQFMAQLYGEELSEKITQDWESGQVTREKIEAAIREHRAQHPYQTPSSAPQTEEAQ